MADEGGAWFAPKRYGYGAGLPIAWQGWALLGGFIALVAGLSWLLSPMHDGILFAVLLPLIAILTVVAARRTRGGWKWRWGNE